MMGRVTECTWVKYFSNIAKFFVVDLKEGANWVQISSCTNTTDNSRDSSCCLLNVNSIKNTDSSKALTSTYLLHLANVLLYDHIPIVNQLYLHHSNPQERLFLLLLPLLLLITVIMI